ncbi:MAG: FG-GAP-like repeat-containing protein [Planctomycetota bacterium]
MFRKLLLLGFLAAATQSVHGQWLDWTRVTGTHLVADPNIGELDVAEKDYAVGDFDQDGDPDVVSVRKAPYTVDGPMPNVLFVNENGMLTDQTAALAPGFLTPDNARDVVAVDINDDGWLDLVIATADNAGVGEQPRVFLNQGLDPGTSTWLGYIEVFGRLPTLLAAPSQGPKSCAIDAGDVNGDGFPDLYMGDYNSLIEDHLFLNDGFGFFSDQTNLLPGTFALSAFNTRVRVADLNGDGAPEILKNTNGALNVAYNQGGGSFSLTQNLNVVDTYGFAVGDLDGDGLNDVYVGQDGQDRYQVNQSAPGAIPIQWQTTQVNGSPLTAGFVGNISIVDLDGDSRNDVVVCDQDTDVSGCTRRLAFLRNVDNGGVPVLFDPHPTPTIAQDFGTYDAAIADFDGDGLLDALVGHCTGTDLYFQVPLVNLFRRGDVNGDGTRDIADSVYLLTFLFSQGPSPACRGAGDANDDGSLDVADAVFQLGFLFGGGIPLPPPGPDCGIDPTPDVLGCVQQPSC